MLFRHLYAASTDPYEHVNDELHCYGIEAHAPSNDEVVAFPWNSISILDMRVGFAILRVSSPRTIAGGALSWRRSRPVGSEVRKKTTDSVNLINKVFFSCHVRF